MLERGVEYFLYSRVGDGQFGAANGVRGNLVGVVDEGDGIVAENEVLRHVDLHVVKVAIGIELIHGAEAGLLLECFQQEGLQGDLETVDEDILGGQQSASLGVEVHDDLLAVGVVAAFTVVDVGQIDHRSLAAHLGVAVDDIVVVIPCVFLGVLPVFVVEGQQRLDVVAGVFLRKGIGCLLHTIVATIQQTLGNGGVDDLSGSSAGGGGLFKADVHAARRRHAVVGEGNALVGCNGLKSDRLNILTASAKHQDEDGGVE